MARRWYQLKPGDGNQIQAHEQDISTAKDALEFVTNTQLRHLRPAQEAQSKL